MSFYIKQSICCGNRVLVSGVFTRNFSISNSLKSKLNDENVKLGFIGTGRISQAIMLGLIKKNKIKPHQIYASDANLEYIKYLKEKCQIFKGFNINYLNSNTEVFQNANTVMICVKPKDVAGALLQSSKYINKNHLILSIAAGIQISEIEKCLVDEARVIRIMTNTAALVQQSCSVFARGKNATDDDASYVRDLLEAIGTCEDEVGEGSLDTITGLSGSGPAYMFVILDALADGAVKMGLSRQLAIRLAAQTMLGSATMVTNELKKDNGKSIMQMKEEVCSPGGTTIHGLSVLEDYKFRSALIKCVEAATKRATEMNAKN